MIRYTIFRSQQTSICIQSARLETVILNIQFSMCKIDFNLQGFPYAQIQKLRLKIIKMTAFTLIMVCKRSIFEIDELL